MSFLTVTRRPDFSVFLCPEAQSAQFFAIQTHPSCRFHLAVDFPGLRRSRSWSQIINQAQDFSEQASRHGNLRQLESDIPSVPDDLGTDLHQFLPQRGERPAPVLLGITHFGIVRLNRLEPERGVP